MKVWLMVTRCGVPVNLTDSYVTRLAMCIIFIYLQRGHQPAPVPFVAA